LGLETTGVLPVRLTGALPQPMYARMGLVLPIGVAILLMAFALIKNSALPSRMRTNFYIF
jgi:hypothetical protein